MMKSVLETAERENCIRITLDVRISNQAAINLYQKFGFKEAGRRKNYYRHPEEDSLILEKVLG